MARYPDPRVEADPEVVAAKQALDNVPDNASYDGMMDAVEHLQRVRRQVWERLGRPFVEEDR